MSRSHLVWPSLVVVAITLTGAGRAAADTSGTAGRTALAIEQGPHNAPPPNYFLFWSGVVAFGFAYNDSIFVAIQSERSADKRLYIPAVGPWLDLGQRDCGPNECHNEGMSKALLIVDGISQDVGLLMMGAAFFVPGPPVDIRMGDVELAPTMLAEGGYGVLASGRF